MIGFGSVPLGGDSEEKGDCMGGHLSWGLSGLNHRLGVPVLGIPRTNRRAMGSLNSAPEELSCA